MPVESVFYPRLKIDSRRSRAASNRLNAYLRLTLVIENLSIGNTIYVNVGVIFPSNPPLMDFLLDKSTKSIDSNITVVEDNPVFVSVRDNDVY